MSCWRSGKESSTREVNEPGSKISAGQAANEAHMNSQRQDEVLLIKLSDTNPIHSQRGTATEHLQFPLGVLQVEQSILFLADCAATRAGV
jgi:hypothetical protein